MDQRGVGDDGQKEPYQEGEEWSWETEASGSYVQTDNVKNKKGGWSDGWVKVETEAGG